ncbi:MAG: ABC transporter ATP-binding protein [Bdellovibrionaceae bacterium]|nr:ABC transporter ATP-binding protein [Pseudobdellovibrionaceae bacterium]
MASALIEFRNVAFSFGDEPLLRDVSFQIQKGEAFSLIGPSGQGKSVVMKLMAGLLTPTAGEVLIDGRSLVTLRGKDREQLLCRMGMLFQKNALFDSLTVGENVAFPLREVRQAPEAEITEAIQFYLEAVGILHAKDLFPDEISGGMQKRLGIARALALKPEIVLYDDPTAGLDPITSRKIIQLIIDLRQEYGSTVVAITNDMNRAYQLGGRIAMVVDGGVIVTGDHDQTLAHPDPRVRQFIRGQLEGPLAGSGTVTT